MIPSKSPIYDILSWEDIHALCQDIVRKIQMSGYDYGAILAVARGGFVPACIVANQLGIRNVFSVSLRRTDSDKQEAELITPEVVGFQPDILRDKDRILVVDDIVDKGESVRFIVTLLQEQGIEKYDIATLVIRPELTLPFPIEYIGTALANWVVFPWEKMHEEI